MSKPRWWRTGMRHAAGWLRPPRTHDDFVAGAASTGGDDQEIGMSRHSLKAMTLISLALMAAVLVPQRALADDDDPPSRVARLGFTSGTVSFQPAGTDDWVAAFINRPITTGDK